MQRRFWIGLVALLAVTLLVSACREGGVDQAVTELNRLATQAAGGTVEETPVGEVPPGEQLPPGEAPAEGQNPPPAGGPATGATFDLTVTGGSLANAWGQTYGLPSGSDFAIAANDQQVAEYIIQRLQQSGWQNNVFGGSAAVGSGQIRVDLALQTGEGDFGGGTFSFQPTIDEAGRLRLNPQGGDLGGLRMEGNFTAAVGDAVYAALAGEPNPDLAAVDLSALVLENGVMRVSGRHR